MLRRKKLNGTLKFKPILLSAATIAASALWGGYVTDGLVLHYDAIDNAGIGKHEDNPEKWVDLTGNGADLDLTSDKIKVGADYIKTSTGFGSDGARLEDIELFKSNIGKNVKIKASGGIRTVEVMEKFILQGCDRIGASSVVPK